MKKKKQNRQTLMMILCLLILVIITSSVTYAFFSYMKEGLTENVIKTGNITFVYEEIEGKEAAISITDAFPMTDEVGKSQTKAGEVFNFKVISNTTTNTSIPYVITARMKETSTLDQSAVKIYLTEVTSTSETELVLSNYDKLGLAANIPEGITERQLYTDIVPAKSTNYEKNYRLRMWIDDSVDYSAKVDEAGNNTYPYNDKSFTVTVNVYANSTVVNDGN